MQLLYLAKSQAGQKGLMAELQAPLLLPLAGACTPFVLAPCSLKHACLWPLKPAHAGKLCAVSKEGCSQASADMDAPNSWTRAVKRKAQLSITCPGYVLLICVHYCHTRLCAACRVCSVVPIDAQLIPGQEGCPSPSSCSTGCDKHPGILLKADLYITLHKVQCPEQT